MDDDEIEPLTTQNNENYVKYRQPNPKSRQNRSQNYNSNHNNSNKRQENLIMPESNRYQNHDQSQNDQNDQNWPGETQTFVSATTDMSHFSQENLAKFPKDKLSKIVCDPQFVSTIFISILAYFTPVLFMVIPFLRGNKACVASSVQDQNNKDSDSEIRAFNECSIKFQSNLLSIVIKLMIMTIMSYWLFWQKTRVIYPRTHWPRMVSLGMMALLTAIFWLFYAVNIIQKNGSPESAVLFAGNSADVLFYIHVIAIIVLELRMRSPNSEKMFLLEVLRSTDGEQKFYNLNKMTIQEAAYMILQNYYRDFPLNNPAAMLVGGSSNRKKMGGGSGRDGLNDSTTANNTQANMNISSKDFKVYNLDSKNTGSNTDDNIVEQSKQVIAAATAKKREAQHAANERYYDQLEWERHCRKRKARLECATEDAFSHVMRHEGHTSRKNIRRQLDKNGDRYPPNIMDANEAATVLFPSIARPLQKYLRTTRQHLHYSLSNTTGHLSESLHHGISYRSFLKRYFSPRPQLAYPSQGSIHDTSYSGGENVEWSIQSESSLTSNITESTIFLLANQDLSLLIQCYEHPRIQLTETFPNSRTKFTLKINTTSV